MISRYFKYTRHMFYSFINDHAENSLISKNESSIIKGILMLLIVYGHNPFLAGDEYRLFLYSFHVYCFYFLPFLYEYKQKTLKELLLGSLSKLVIVYTLVFFMLCLIKLYQSNDISLENILKAYVTGSQYNLREALNSGGFLWFIPTYISLQFIRWMYYKKSRSVRVVLIIISIISLVCYSFDFCASLLKNAPCSCLIALGMLAPSLLLRHMVSKKVKINMILLFWLVLIFTIFPFKDNLFYEYRILSRLIGPLLMFIFILSLRYELIKVKFISLIGQQSLYIYIIHIFIYQGLRKFIIVDTNINIAVGIFIITLILSLFLSFIFVKKNN